jgi:hypothetical protein
MPQPNFQPLPSKEHAVAKRKISARAQPNVAVDRDMIDAGVGGNTTLLAEDDG